MRVFEASEMNAAHRPSMEDEHRVVQHNFLPTSDSSLFAVYDGHGGRGVVEFVTDRLEENIRAELSDEFRAGRSVEECLTSAFLITDIETAKRKIETSGSTAVVCLLVGGNELYTANCGDSRAVLGRRRRRRSGGDGDDVEAVRLSFDHKASDPGEAARISACGGFVRGGRAMGMLTVSRSFGDHVMKSLITALPHVSRTTVNTNNSSEEGVGEGTGDLLILACDGMWDVFEDDEAVRFCFDWLSSSSSSSNKTDNLARALIDECLKRRTTDNVTVVVVEL